MITVKQAADALGVTPQRIRALIKAGRLPSATLVDTERGPVWRIDPADLERPDIKERPGGRPRQKGAHSKGALLGIVRHCTVCGDTHHNSAHHTTARTRFWQKVLKGDGCWLWQAAISNEGYGKFYIAGRTVVQAHRYAYEDTYGPIKPGLLLCHHCDNRLCVRPDHMFPGTPGDNVRDMWAKGRAGLQHRTTTPTGDRAAGGQAVEGDTDV